MTAMNPNFVVLVNEHDEDLGVMEKMQAHVEGRLHRAFSIFIFNRKGEMLLQQRALGKYHSAGLWTNACCSHPMWGESVEDAAHRRLQEELGFDCDLRKQYAFTYHAAFSNGLQEHELDHVFFGEYEGEIKPNPEEVASFRYVGLEALREEMRLHPERFTEWFKIILDSADLDAMRSV